MLLHSLPYLAAPCCVRTRTHSIWRKMWGNRLVPLHQHLLAFIGILRRLLNFILTCTREGYGDRFYSARSPAPPWQPGMESFVFYAHIYCWSIFFMNWSPFFVVCFSFPFSVANGGPVFLFMHATVDSCSPLWHDRHAQPQLLSTEGMSNNLQWKYL